MTVTRTLTFACHQTFALEKVRLLLMYGAEVNRMNGTQLSPLVAALTTRRARHPHTPPSYLTLIRLLLAAGASLSAALLDRIKVLILYLHSAADDKDELFQVLTQHTAAPASLQRQCRAAIRHQMGGGGARGGNVDLKARRLPLPTAVVHFMQFSDVPGCPCPL